MTVALGPSGRRADEVGWTRRIEVADDGVHLTEGKGALAWFRGTGRYRWDDLASATTRWARQLEVALAAAPPSMWIEHDEKGDDTRVALAFVPGFVEPVGRTIVDQVRRLP